MAQNQRTEPNMLITETPGTGKTTMSSALAEATGLRHIEVGELVKQKNLHHGWDEELECHVIDEDLAIASCLKSRYGMSLMEKMKVLLVELLFFFLTTRNNLELRSKSLGFGLGKKQMAQ
ncbi:hypothetical protein Droror1_Dr00024782 [Drosera rotundifolia]